MFASIKFSSATWGLLLFLIAEIATSQNSISTSQPSNAVEPTASFATGKRMVFDDFVESVVRQEGRMTGLMRRFQPIIETYIQEEGARPRFQAGITPNGDDYFLGRLNLTENLSIVPFADEETWKRTEGNFVQDPAPFMQVAFAQALFPDFDHFDRQNYTFQFVRWETLGDVRCAVVDVTPREKWKNRGFVGRIWVEEQDHSIVRFTGTFTKGFAQRAFHFDSWRLSMAGIGWMPAYVYTEESNSPFVDPQNSNRHGESRHTLWFKAQTRVWGYGPQAQDRSPAYMEGQPIYAPEDTVVQRAEVAGLMAPSGNVDQILQTVLNNLLITNDLDSTDLRCRVLLTTPLESFVMGHTIVLSRGLLDVLPDEATLAAMLAHELAHVVLRHPVNTTYLTSIAWPFPDSEIFAALNFHFDGTEEKEADRKAMELFSKSPYKDQLVNVDHFLQALDANSARYPNLLHGRFSNDFGNNHLFRMRARIDSRKAPKKNQLDQPSALPLGSRIVIDPLSDRIEMLKSKPLPLRSAAENIPFEVTPFYPHLKRADVLEKSSQARQ